MKRKEFIETCSGLSRSELLEIAVNARKNVEKMISEDTKAMFHRLDEETVVEERYFETGWGRMHVYVVRSLNHKDEKLPVVVNAHGGGWTLEHSERDLYFCRRMAHLAGCVVFDIDYVLAPEHPYPAALEEIEAFINILPEICEKYNGDITRLLYCGQSAGGNLLGAVTQRRKTVVTPVAQILCYPPTDNYNDHFHGSELDERGMRTEYYGFFYNQNFEERSNHDVSIAFSTVEELKGLPDTDVITAGMDTLCPEGERYANLLKEAGVKTTYRCFANSRHGFAVNLYDEWKEGETYITELMKKHFAVEK